MTPGTIDKREILVLTVIIAIVILLLFTAIVAFHPIGPGLPPNMDFSGVMVSGQTLAYPNCSAPETSLGDDRKFCIAQTSLGSYPRFHEMSPMASYAILQNANTSAKRVAAFWYFTNKTDFDQDKKQLLHYLSDNGRVRVAGLDLSNAKDDDRIMDREATQPINGDNSRQLTGTLFIGNDTAGYFFIVEHPVSPTHESYFIEYFGLVGETEHAADSKDLARIIGENGDGWYLFSGRTGPLQNSTEL